MATYKRLSSSDIRRNVRLLGELRALQERINLPGVPFPMGGICHRVSVPIRHLFDTWPHYTGRSAFPVPGVNGRDPSDQLLSCGSPYELWGADTQYGALRRDLLTHCINETKRVLDEQAALLEALQMVQHAPRTHGGICVNLALRSNIPSLVIDAHFVPIVIGWPYYSGDEVYPIPSATFGESAKQAYKVARESGELWEGAYGDLRRDLLAYCIDVLNTGLRGYTP